MNTVRAAKLPSVAETPPTSPEINQFPASNGSPRLDGGMYVLFAFAFFSLLFVPGLLAVRTFLHPSSNAEKLGGVEKIAKLPLFNANSFFSGEYQERFEKWLNSHLGFRGALIRTDNQLNLSFFGFTSGRTILG